MAPPVLDPALREYQVAVSWVSKASFVTKATKDQESLSHVSLDPPFNELHFGTLLPMDASGFQTRMRCGHLMDANCLLEGHRVLASGLLLEKL